MLLYPEYISLPMMLMSDRPAMLLPPPSYLMTFLQWLAFCHLIIIFMFQLRFYAIFQYCVFVFLVTVLLMFSFAFFLLRVAVLFEFPI